MAYGTEAVSLDDTNMYDSAVDTVERLRRALEQCRDDRKALSEAVDALIEERDQYDADYVQAVGRIEELERELAECRDDRKALSEAVDALIEERDAYDADLAECQQELAQAKENCIALTDAGRAWKDEAAAAEEREVELRQLLHEAGPYYSTGDYARCRWCHNTKSQGHEVNCSWLRVMICDVEHAALNAALEQARAEEQKHADALHQAIDLLMNSDEYREAGQVSEDVADALWEAWCAYGEHTRSDE